MCAFVNFLFVVIFFFFFGCNGGKNLSPECYAPAGCSSTEEETDTDSDADGDTDTDSDTDTDTDTDSDADGDTDTDTGTSFEESQLCWESVPFEVQFLEVDRSVAEFVAGDWSSIQWLDYDPVFVLDASSESSAVTIYSPGACGNASAIEGEIYLPDGFEMRDESDELYNNGIIVSFQPDGTIAEVNYLEPCGDGSFSGWLMPDAGFQDACDPGYSSSEWLGAHGGSHTTATQAIRPGELTSSSPIGRPLPIEVDHTHLACPEGATTGYDCYAGPLAASGDAYALSEYSGTIPELTMGSILVLPEDFDCSSLLTRPGQRLCEVGSDHFFFIVDDSYGEDEVAFPIAEGVAEEVEALEGIPLHNASGSYKADVEAIMASILVLANPDDPDVIK